MDILQITMNDKVYNKYKHVVKNWEKQFKREHLRTPSKFDIKEAPSNIKYAYKKYFQLKSAVLENSVSICDITEETTDSKHLENSTWDVLSPLSVESNSQYDPDLPPLPTCQEVEKLLSEIPSKVHCTSSPLTLSNVTKKIINSKKFSIRNPRKSLPKSQFINENHDGENKCKLEVNSQVDNIEKLNTDDTNNTKQTNIDITCQVDNIEKLNTDNTKPTNFAITYNHLDKLIDKSITPKLRKFNKAWLERASVIDSEDTSLSEIAANNINHMQTSNATDMCIIRDQVLDCVENSASENDDITLDKLKPALKKRRTCKGTVNIKGKTNKEKHFEKKSCVKKPRNLKNKINHIENAEYCLVVKSSTCDVNQQPPDITEFVPFGLDKDVAPRFAKPTDILDNLKDIRNDTVVKKFNETGNLDIKIRNGTLNDNFVKINIDKKVFVRGKKQLNYTKYKKQLWKKSKALHTEMEFPESGKLVCFKCKGVGHMARFCPVQKGDTLLPLDTYNENDIPTLEDMQNIVSSESNDLTLEQELTQSVFESSEIPESFLKLLSNTSRKTENLDFRPIYNDYHTNTPQEVKDALRKFGFDKFRPGQEETIMRILCGKSTLLLLSTGGGKSLCYQLPAYIYSLHYKSIVLVISPLVALMEDQVINMPQFVKAGCLHSNQSPTQRHKIMQCIQNGDINILLLSPEALISGDGSRGFAGLFKILPQIAFVCIDEAHCVSQWSHNFRPSYLMLCRVLREKLKVKCILGLTATANQSTIQSIINHCDITDGLSGVITNPTLPDNLLLSVSIEKDKDKALVALLSTQRVALYNSIIVYCIRRDECERIAAILRSCLQAAGKIDFEKRNNKRKRMSYIAEAYHAGMSAAQRKKIQKNFMDGTLRIIVATVAFGMGINKADIQCIIHYNMPRNFESYIQEVGRAGRDGSSSYCHILMSTSDSDKNEHLKHIHGNTVDRATIRKLLEKVFIPCKCKKIKGDATTSSTATQRCEGHEVAIPIDDIVNDLDLPSENIATLLCYIELHPKKYIKVLNNAYTMCKIASYGGSQIILKAAKHCPPLAMAYLLETKKDPEVANSNILEFNVIEIAAAIGWESGLTKYNLKQLEWISESGMTKRSQLKIEFNTLAFRIKSSGDLSPSELDGILDDLHKLVQSQERTVLCQLEECHQVFSKLGNNSVLNYDLAEDVVIKRSNELKNTISAYLVRDNIFSNNITLQKRPVDTERVTADVRALLSSYRDCVFTGRSIARIFQGITSPNFPAIVWGRCKYWRSHMHEDFYEITKIATQQIIQMKMS